MAASKAKLYDIHCPSCGSPANYDIRSGVYNCAFCGNKVKIDRAISDHKGFREIRQRKMNAELKKFEMEKAVCTGCGAELVFDKGDALANCAFCGRALVRKAFVNSEDIPELIIPFSVTQEEARGLLVEWCNKNSHKKEAKALLKRSDELQGFYLPYELVRGPVECVAWRIDGGRSYKCGGFVDELFVNCSKKLDNRLLDGMEPYDLDELTEFDFAYVAGHQVKVGDITGEELTRRINCEVTDDYTPVLQKTLESKAVRARSASDNVVRMPVLLPVYYISFGEYMAAVNGQTGKVSVRAVKESHYVLLPWWLKAILSTIGGTAVIALGMFLLGAEHDLILGASGALGLFLLIVLLTAYSDNMQNRFLVEADRKIFTSKDGPYTRENGKLVKSDKELSRPVMKPVFFMNIKDSVREVEIKFTTFYRFVRMIGLALLVMFLPVIVALFVNGFNFPLLNLGGSAVWFCITVPLTPVILIKYGRIELYDNPWIYIIDEKGKKKRDKPERDSASARLTWLFIKEWLKPPLLWGTLVMLGIFCIMVYLTAFGDW